MSVKSNGFMLIIIALLIPFEHVIGVAKLSVDGLVGIEFISQYRQLQPRVGFLKAQWVCALPLHSLSY